MKTKLTLALALTLLLSSCGSTAQDVQTSAKSDETTAPATETEAVTEPLTERERRFQTKDTLPEKDFGGKQFRISAKDGMLYEIDTEATDGDVCNDALWERNQRIEERFNVDIVAIPVNDPDGYTHTKAVQTSILASDDAFDLAATYVFTTGPLVLEGCYLNWLNMPYNDFSKPWWINGINDKFRVGDALYTAVGDMCVSTLTLTYGMFYNRTRGADYDLNDEVYSSIKDGSWTLDKFNKIVADIYTDLNGNGTRDNDDFYGFTAEKFTNLDIYTFAFDLPIIEQDDNGIPQLVLNTERTVTAVEKVNDLYWNTPGTLIPEDPVTPLLSFIGGRSLFCTTWLLQAFTNFRDMEDNYSILPYPKLDETQEKYMTGAMDNYSVLGIPVTVTDPEFVSLIAESLNVESYRTLFPAYYEEALQDKYTRDEESIGMIDMLMKGRNFDFCTLFAGNLNGMSWIVRSVIADKSGDFASAYARNEKGAQDGLKKILEAYAKNADM